MGRYISNTSSYQDNELLLLKQGIAKNRKEFLIAGTNTWTIDHDVIVRVRVWGGGGGGGGGGGYQAHIASGMYVSYGIPGGGGGAGGSAEAILRLSAGTYNITVGAGGTAGKGAYYSTGGSSTSGTSSTSGGSSSFHTYITCSGGGGGASDFNNEIYGGAGGTTSFDWSGFDGLLYADGRIGGAGGSFKARYYMKSNNSEYLGDSFLFSDGSEKGEGESGGPGGYVNQNLYHTRDINFLGCGGGGYNAPFIYGTNISAQANSGRGVGTGGNGARGNRSGSNSGRAGNSGAVVIEWN